MFFLEAKERLHMRTDNAELEVLWPILNHFVKSLCRLSFSVMYAFYKKMYTRDTTFISVLEYSLDTS
jgi:hypothetical protein